MIDFAQILTEEFQTSKQVSENLIKLIEEGNTIPFIARYRKEMHNNMNDQIIRTFADRYQYLKNLNERRESIRNSINEKGKLTEKLKKALDAAKTLVELEDIYAPFKEKKQTRATKAQDAGLKPLADIFMQEKGDKKDPSIIAVNYIVKDNPDFDTVEKCISGAKDIIAEEISNDSELRKKLRTFYYEQATLFSKIKKDKEEGNYSLYVDFKEKAMKMPNHRVLAVNRGEKEGILSIKLDINQEEIESIIQSKYFFENLSYKDEIISAIKDSAKRLIIPSLERETRSQMTDNASEQAIKMFETNLKPLLMQAPLKGKVILGFDPAYRTGCKLAVIDEKSQLLDIGIIHPTPPKPKIEESKTKLLDLINKHKIDIIAIGNGTASKESEIFVAELIKENNLNVKYAMVNEAGASVYSASELATKEFPELDVAIRSAISIARRLQDPLAELVKIDVKSIGVGQYQHDMPQKRLTEVLEGVVEDTVNSVGVDLNTASPSLLSYVSGLTKTTANKIVEKRNEIRDSGFESREELKEVCKLNDKVYEQCVGFLRIPKAKNILDQTAVHPESYEIANKLIDKYNIKREDIEKGIVKIKERAEKDNLNSLALELNVGVPTLVDILEEIEKPGRDIREDVPLKILRDDIMSIDSLLPGMELEAVIRNVIDFGAFADIGVHQDGLIHISQMSKQFVKHASELLKVGDVVNVKVIEVDKNKNKISLSLFTDKNPDGIKIYQEKPKKSIKANQKNKKFNKEEKEMMNALRALKNKFGN